MARWTVLCLVAAALAAGGLWVADAARTADPAGDAPTPPASRPPPHAPAPIVHVQGDFVVSAWLTDKAPNPQATQLLTDWLPASEVMLHGDTAVLRWRESITPDKSVPAGWAILPVGQLRALIALEAPDATRVTALVIDLLSAPASCLVSLDERRLVARPPSAASQEALVADLLIDPADPAIAGLGSSVDGHRHVGDDTGVALLPAGGPGFDDLKALPAQVHWQQSIPEESIAPGVLFLARSSTGQAYKVRIDDLEKRGRRMRLSFARLRMP